MFLVASSLLIVFQKALLHAQGGTRILRSAYGSSVGAMLFDGATLNLDRKHGLFGWLSGDETFTSIFLLGFLCTICANAGYYVAMV